MRCETSFFSFTLYKKHLKRYWPLWAAWLAFWLLAIPVQLWNRATWYYADSGHTLRAYAAEMPLNVLTALFPLLACLAASVAVAVFFHLFKSPAANFVGALPLRREGVFATAFAAGYTMMVGPLAVVTVVTILVEMVLGCGVAPQILTFLAAGALSSFFWFSFATLCCVISGHAVAAVAFYGIFNWIVPVMVALIEGLLSGFLYGFVGFTQGFYEVSNWLCPVMQLMRHHWYQFVDWNMLAIYAAVGFLMLLSSLGLHHIRKAERCGDLIAFVPVKWLFKICVTFCGGMGFGTFLTILIFNNMSLSTGDGSKFGVCCAVAAFLCYMASEMLLAKSFKVWKHWKGAVISAVCFILAVAAVDMDWIGFTTRIPNPASVKEATVSIHGSELASVVENGLIFTGEDVKAVTDLHQYLVDHRGSEEISNAASIDRCYLNVQMDYDLGWTSLRRKYTCSYYKGGQMDQLLDEALARGDISFPYDSGTPNVIYLDLRVPVEADYTYISCEISPEDLKPVWDAVTADVRAGRYALRTAPTSELRESEGGVYARWYSADGRTEKSYEMSLSPEMTETWKELEARRYTEAASQFVDTELVD